MPMPRTPLPEIIRKLRARYGPPKRMPASGPFELIVWENVAYLVDDERRLHPAGGAARAQEADPRADRAGRAQRLAAALEAARGVRNDDRHRPRAHAHPAARERRRSQEAPQALPGNRRAGGGQDPAVLQEPAEPRTRLQRRARAGALGLRQRAQELRPDLSRRHRGGP